MHNLIIKTKLKNAKAKAVRDGVLTISGRICALLASINAPIEVYKILTKELQQVLVELSHHDVSQNFIGHLQQRNRT